MDSIHVQHILDSAIADDRNRFLANAYKKTHSTAIND